MCLGGVTGGGSGFFGKSSLVFGFEQGEWEGVQSTLSKMVISHMIYLDLPTVQEVRPLAGFLDEKADI